MKRLLLFSHVIEAAQRRVFPLLFPEDLQPKVFACMPGDGALQGRRYSLFCDSWRTIANQHGAEFLYIDNSKAREDTAEEWAKIRSANILLITGGNACVLLRNIRRSGLDQAILDFTQKEAFVLAGYSAGAMLLTPTIQLAAFGPEPNENEGVGLTTFDALHLVNYEIFPHYSDETKELFEQYTHVTTYDVKPLADDEYLCVDAPNT